VLNDGKLWLVPSKTRVRLPTSAAVIVCLANFDRSNMIGHHKTARLHITTVPKLCPFNKQRQFLTSLLWCIGECCIQYFSFRKLGRITTGPKKQVTYKHIKWRQEIVWELPVLYVLWPPCDFGILRCCARVVCFLLFCLVQCVVSTLQSFVLCCFWAIKCSGLHKPTVFRSVSKKVFQNIKILVDNSARCCEIWKYLILT
jgi:hypothetical protein